MLIYGFLFELTCLTSFNLDLRRIPIEYSAEGYHWMDPAGLLKFVRYVQVVTMLSLFIYKKICTLSFNTKNPTVYVLHALQGSCEIISNVNIIPFLLRMQKIIIGIIIDKTMGCRLIHTNGRLNFVSFISIATYALFVYIRMDECQIIMRAFCIGQMERGTIIFFSLIKATIFLSVLGFNVDVYVYVRMNTWDSQRNL